MIEIKRISTEDHFYEAERNLRNVILLRPIGLPDHAWEMHDKDSWHFVAIEKDKLIGCVVLYPWPNENSKAQLMQMAIDTAHQGKGIGKLLVNKLLLFAKENGIEEVVCHSRKTVNVFYEKLGFKIQGEAFEEVGIPHNNMSIDCANYLPK